MKTYILITIATLLFSCTKRVSCEGVLYSRNRIPVPNILVYFHVYGSASSYPTKSQSCMTDASGKFYFYENVNKKYPMELEVFSSDSGRVRKSLGKPVHRTYIRQDITLHW